MSLGIPLEIHPESAVIGLSLKSRYYLPPNASDVWHSLTDPFDISKNRIAVLRRRSANEIQNDDQENKLDKRPFNIGTADKGMVNDPEYKDEPNNLSSMRWLVYKGLAQVAEK